MRTFLFLIATALLLPACAAAPSGDAQRTTSDVLDTLHAAAARADFDAYFACFSDDAVFLGTDATERWTVEQFKAYAKPHFDAGRGWKYTSRDRHITLDYSDRRLFAIFDELLDNDKYGVCRGSGVLVREGSPKQWKIAQYNLAFMVPNEVAAEVTQITKRPKN